MTANLYDLLDVPESASEQEIRTAWKAAIADLDPTERRFRAFNDAAGVLLDPDARAAYDADLAAARDAEAGAEGREDRAESVATPPVTDAADTEQTRAAAAETAPPAEPGPRPSPGPPGWAFGAAGVGALVALVLAIYLFAQPGGRLFTDDSPRSVAERNSAAERATIAAEGAAEQMVAPVLSYGFETMEADLDRRLSYLSPDLAKKVSGSWPELTKEAQAQEIDVEATSVGTALTRLSADGRRATVVVFVDQRTEKKDSEPFVLHMWATMQLLRDSADADTWLLNDVCVDSGCE